MKTLNLRRAMAITGGMVIGSYVALLSIPVNLIPCLIAGGAMGLLMACSEPAVEAY